MKLWIRSQDKKILIPINNSLYIPQSRTGEDYGIFYKDIMLGYFTKEERALEVLDEIQDIMISSEYMNINDDEVMTCGSFKVYEMPKK